MAGIIPNTYKEALILPAKVRLNAAPDKKVESHKITNIYTSLAATFVPSGRTAIGSQWVFKMKTDN